MKNLPFHLNRVLAEIILLLVIGALLLAVLVNLSQPVQASTETIAVRDLAISSQPQAPSPQLAGALTSQIPLFTPILLSTNLPLIGK
jgi:hypothetical protein